MNSFPTSLCSRDRWSNFGVRGLLACCFVWSVAASAALAEPAEAADLDADPDLMGWWKFDDASGTTATDSSQHDRNGELMGDLAFDRNSVSGPVGKALQLDNREDFVQITGYKGVTGTKPRTISVWIKTEAAGGEIVSWGKNDFGSMWQFKFIRGRVGVTPKGGYYYMADRVDDKAWHHVAVVMREAELPNLHDDVTLYLDGKVAEVHRIGLLDLWPIETGA
ncbi:MAG: LamG-like jellyroll fold domain-containing protein, partial [Pirellulaceae bacterium]